MKDRINFQSSWVSVDSAQPSDHRIVLVCGFFKEERFVSFGFYDRDLNWWEVLSQAGNFVMIEFHEATELQIKVKVKYWMELPEFAEEMGV